MNKATEQHPAPKVASPNFGVYDSGCVETDDRPIFLGDDVPETVNLDALIPREDFIAPFDSGMQGSRGKESASTTDLRRGESFFETLRKPDFQRETAAWSPTAVCDFIEAFVDDDLIPSVICWQSPARLSFIIDGAHRLSCVIAWIQDDYGGGEQSTKFYGRIPLEQERIHLKTQKLVKERVGSFAQWQAEIAKPGTIPEIGEKWRNLSFVKVPLLWVQGADATKAEKAFFTINQKAVEIDTTELKILNARSRPNAVAARTIVRNATGTKYWESFSEAGQLKVVETANRIYHSLYSPPLQTPPWTEELPIAGHGYGSQTLPLVFDLVNIANKFPVEDATKNKKKYIEPQGHVKPDEAGTIEAMKRTSQLVSRITGTDPPSLGLHPAVYFYAVNYRHQPTAVLAVAKFVQNLIDSDGFLEFTRHRKRFEEFLIEHKMFINQLTLKHGSMVKGFQQICDYYEDIFKKIKVGLSDGDILTELTADPKYQTLVKERPVRSNQVKDFTRDAKAVKLMGDVLENALFCNVCGARIDKKSMHLDHIIEKSKGGTADLQNSQWLHPYCDSTAKRKFAEEAEAADAKRARTK